MDEDSERPPVDDDDEVNRLRILRFRSLIVDDLHPSHILFYMPRFHDIMGEIMKAERSNRAEAASVFVDKLIERSGPLGWFSEFFDALQQAGFENLVKHLSMDDVKDDKIFPQLISLGKPSLLEVKPMEIMSRLVQENVISIDDMQEIEQLAVDCGDRNAMIDLLFRLPRHQKNWFSAFVVALREANYEAQLRALEPLLQSTVSESDGRIQDILNEAEHESSEEFASNPEKKQKLPQDEASLADSAEERKEFQESREPSLKMNAPSEKIYSRDGNLSDVAAASVQSTGRKPVAAATRFPQSNLLNLSTGVEQETPLKHLDRNELSGRETNSANVCVHSGERETSPKTLNTSYNITIEQPNDDQSEFGDLNLVSERFPTASCAAQMSGLGFEELSEEMSCVDNNCSRHQLQPAPDDATLIDVESRISESEETVLVPNEVFVSNLPLHVTKEEIVEHFGLIGDIQLNSRGNPKVRLYRDKETREPTGEAIITYALDMYADAAVEIFNATEFEGNILAVEIRRRRIRRSEEDVTSPDRTLVPDRDEQEEEDNTLCSGGGTGEIHEQLHLRSYQEELAEKAKEGRNCVILAPTGSGKTHVAMEIIRHHVAQMAERGRNPTVVFFVPTVALVEQQRKQFVKYLKDSKIIGLSGDQDAKLPLSELLPTNDIIVLTPQILENALKEGDIETMSVLSLLIFDECHHTHKNHPYNMIMSHYIDEKLGRNHPQKLPQVVGLTASVGVGKSKTMDQAVQCILRLCANLDAMQICTVKTHLEELMKHVNRPLEDIKEISGRTHDPFFGRINVIMGEIETEMKRSNHAKSAVEENREFLQLLLAPAERGGGDRYTQWISRLQKQVDALQDQKTRRFYVSCLKHLQIYNTALLINADCRTIDALDYIKKEFNPAMVNDLYLYHDGTDNWLEELFKRQRDYLENVSRDPQYENPMLNWLKKLICEEFDNIPDSRGIIFCKTREMTVALVNWMKDTKELRKFNPHNLVGTNAPSNKAGMTQVKQVDVLEYFKTGDHKLIVATSVAEEGLDVQKCNLVIRYGHVTNQIARVQSRGRARADNAQYLVVAEKGRGAAEKEESNKIREKMMQKAIDIINASSVEQRRKDIHRYQREAQVEREMAKKGKEISQLTKASRGNRDAYTLRCQKCDSFTAYASDIRKIEASHHVILDPDYRNRIKIRPHPAPKTFENFELTGKIFCKKCHADWGIMGVYKKVSLPVVKVCSLIVIREDGDRKVYKRWKEVPFQVQALTPDDLQTMMDHHTNEMAAGGDQDTSYVDEDEEDEDDDFWAMYND